METIKNSWKNRYIYAKYIALAATPLSSIGFVMMMKNTVEGGNALAIWPLMFVMGLILSCCAYCLGGLWTAIKSALAIAWRGWFVVPFPYDVVTGIVAFIFAVLAFFLLPIIPISKALKEYEMKQIR